MCSALRSAVLSLLATRHPGRIDHLVLSSTFRAGVPLLSINPGGLPNFVALRTRLPESAREFAEYFFPRDYIAAHPQVLGIFTANKRDAQQKQRRAAILARPVELDLGAITAPTLVVAGSEDRLIPPAHTLSLAHEIADAQTATITGVGHVGTVQNPVAVAHKVLAVPAGTNKPSRLTNGKIKEGKRSWRPKGTTYSNSMTKRRLMPAIGPVLRWP
jgi:pimeloyl-ACP methyl ester carboxylesterase